MRPASLRSRLFLAIALVVVLSVGITLAVGTVLTRRSVERANADDLGRQADLVAERERAELLPLGRPRRLRESLAEQGLRVEFPRLASPSALLSTGERAALRDGLPVQGSARIEGKRYLFAARPVVPGRRGRALVLLRPAALRTADWRPFVQGLLIAGLAGATLAALVSLWLARAIARPVRRVADASRSLADGSAPAPVPVEGSDELASLALSFNRMAVQLERARRAERSFLLSVSHELKTPLTAIRGYGEALGEGAVPPGEAGEVIVREARRLERLVRDLLDLARMEQHEFAVGRDTIDLAEAARETVRRYAGQARAFGVSLAAEGNDEAPAIGDEDRVVQVLANLVENALRSTPPGGSVGIGARPGMFTVTDTGLGFPTEDLPRAFERFYLWSRHKGDRPVGTGLGLAIVKELTVAMGGSVEVTSEPGRGTTFVVFLPAPAEGEDGDAEGRRDRASARAPGGRS